MNNKVILVDLDNNKVGNEDKIEAHKKSLLHRAFQFLFLIKIKKFYFKKEPKINITQLYYGLILVVVIPMMDYRQSNVQKLD